MAEVVNLMEKSEEKKKALEAALSQIEKNYGKGSVMKLGDPENVVEIEAISTGSLGL
ncbi:MAG: DNA recombination/repair protein RecA, partial [Rhodobiaceae bacterium]